MGDEYMDAQDSMISEHQNQNSEISENVEDSSKDFGDMGMGFDDGGYDDDDGNNFRGNRGRGNFRRGGRGPPPNWLNGPPPPIRFRGRGYGPSGPPMRGRGFFRGRGGPRFGPNNGPQFDNNWGPMGPPPPGMMGGPPPFGPPPGMMPPGGPMGPPPNMMGQPPPFAGATGMPPNMQQAQEVWVETKCDDGKAYYYHSRTRETTWTRPQDPNVKVISQAEVEAMATAGQFPTGMSMTTMVNPLPGQMGQPMVNPLPGQMGQPMVNPLPGQMGQPMVNPLPGQMAPPMGVMGNGMPQAGGASYLNRPPPWMKEPGVQDNMEEGNENESEEMPPGEQNQAANGAGMPPGFPGGPPGWGGGANWAPPYWPPGMQPPNMQPTAAPGTTPIMQQPPPVAGANTGPIQGDPGAVQPTDPPGTLKTKPTVKKPTVIPPALQARAAEWTTHKSPDGRNYYYHAGKQESVWEKPRPLRELESLQYKIAIEKGEPVERRKSSKDKKPEVEASKAAKPEENTEVSAEAAAAAKAEQEVAAKAEREAEKERELEAEREREREAEKQREKEREEKEKEKERAKQDKTRPICSTPISGTPWCVVWTGDGRVFFYNPTAHSSVWERPEQLAGRSDVDKAISSPPDSLTPQRKETATTSKGANGELKRGSDDKDDSDADPPKKHKQDEAMTSKKAGIEASKEAAAEAEMRAARERAVVPHGARLRAFLLMLHEKDVSAFSAWEKELHKIVFDPRYLMLDARERRTVFDQYVRDRAEEERKEMKNRLQQKKTAFKQLMEEAKLHSKSSFSDFSSKHGRDERFKAIEKPRDRTSYFNEFIVEVRKREKEEKEKKREQARLEFIVLLKEKSVDRHSRWAEIKKKLDADPRYKAVESSALREDHFREYCKIMKEERKKEKDNKEKEKERERSSKKEKKDKERDKERDKDKDKDKDSKKKKEKGEKPGDTEEERKQPTPPPDQWAEILGIPGEEKESTAKGKTKRTQEVDTDNLTLDKLIAQEKELSPKQLRSSKKEQPTPEKKSPIKSPPKKRRLEEFIVTETEDKKKKKTEKKKTEKTEKKKRKKSEKE